MEWEHKIVYICSDTEDEREYEERLHESVHTLDKFGSEGWELAGFLHHRTEANVAKYHAVFKREKKS